MQTANGSLVMVDLNTTTPSVFWNGAPVPNITSIRVDWEGDEQRVKLKVSAIDPLLNAELIVAGISVKKGNRHE